MLKKIRRRIKDKIPKSIRDYFFFIKHIPKRFSNYEIVCENLKNYKTLEVGSPSTKLYNKMCIISEKATWG